MTLHINIEDLLSAKTVENDRIEYKKAWNPDSIYRSICAFANDIENTGGGYILIGVEEEEVTKTAQRPVFGLKTSLIARIQKQMLGFNNLLKPVYNPRLFIETIDDRQIVILWVPGGVNRPYQAPKQITAKEKVYYYYLRRYANSVRANLDEQQELIALANKIPFDDRANTQANLSDVSMLLLREYLNKIKSKLATLIGEITDQDILGQMELTFGPKEQLYPRNIALMMFTDAPEQFFPYTQVEIVEFPDGDAGKYFENPPIRGPIDLQIRRTLNYLRDKVLKSKIIKQEDKEESIHPSLYLSLSSN